MLKFIDKVLTRMIDWLYLKRTVLRLKMQVQGMEGDGISKYDYPVKQESIDKCLGEYGLSVEQLSKTGAHFCAENVNAVRQA